jgi:hypothetical protein
MTNLPSCCRFTGAIRAPVIARVEIQCIATNRAALRAPLQCFAANLDVLNSYVLCSRYNSRHFSLSLREAWLRCRITIAAIPETLHFAKSHLS